MNTTLASPRWSTSFASTAVASIGIPAAGMLSGFALARNFDPAARGAFAIAQLLTLFAATLASVGANMSLAYFLPGEDTEERRKGLLRSAIVLASVATIPASAVVVVVGSLLAHNIDELSVSTVLICLCYLPSTVGSLIVQGWLRGRDLVVAWNVSRLVPTATWAISAMVALALGADQTLAAVLFALSGLAGLIVSLLLTTGSSFGFSRVPTLRRSEVLHYGSHTVLASIPRTINLRLDALLIAAFLSPRDAGLYLVANMLVGLIPQLSTIRPMVAFAQIAGESRVERRRLSVRVLKQSARSAVLLGIVVAGIAPFAIRVLFDDAYADSAMLAVALVPAGILLAIGRAATELLLATGVPRSVLRIELVGAVIAVVALAVLLPLFGLIGAVLSSTISYCFTTLIALSRLDSTTRHHDDVGTAP